jgi:phosphoribosyl-dephospho-CoA transferase
MDLLQRNQLVWLQKGAWKRILTAPWDAQAFSILQHWAQADLPLVVARQRADVVQDRICVGLPAPAKWERRRLALDVAGADVSKIGLFPLLAGVMPIASSLPAVFKRFPVRVYGSYAWQSMTGMDYVHAASDLDVLLQAKSMPQAIELATALKAWVAPCRVDGELVFPSGHAVAWRELLLAHEGAVSKVLVKHRQSAALMDLHQLASLALVRLEPLLDTCET